MEHGCISNKTKKIFIVAIALVAIGIVSFFIVKHFIGADSDNDSGITTAEKDIQILSEKYPTKILVYGEMLEFDDAIATENITEITEETLKKDDEFMYELIVINDLSGKYALSDEAWKIIEKVVNSGNDVNFIYLGNVQFDKIFDAKIVDRESLSLGNSDLSVGVFYEGETKTSVCGTYTSESGTTQKDICEAVMREEVYSIQLGNE